MARLMPRRPVPALRVDTAEGPWELAGQSPERFSMVVFYRGLHCPVCRGYIGELNGLVEEFAQRGVEVIAISSDTAERAGRTRADWKLDALRLGWALSPEQASAWGLYRSASRGRTLYRTSMNQARVSRSPETDGAVNSDTAYSPQICRCRCW